MNKVSLLGAGETVVTLKASGAVALGQPVKLSADRTVSACGDGDAVTGICVSKNGGYLGVQLAGYLRVSYSGSLSYGWQHISANGSGGIKAAADSSDGAKSRPCLIVELDTAAQAAGILL